MPRRGIWSFFGWRPSRIALWCVLSGLTMTVAELTPRLPGQAQAFTASLSGSVTDASGGLVPGAELTLENTQEGISRTTASSGNGSYVFSLLPPGTYSLRASKSGFQGLVRNGIVLTVGGASNLTITLKVGQSAQTIEVTGGAPILNTSNANLGSEVTQRQVLEMPLNLRNVYGLVTLDSSVNNSTQKQLLNPGGVNSDYDDQDIAFFNFGGGRFGTTAFLSDGTWNASGDWGGTMYAPGVDETQEFKIETNSFSAQYGWSMGNVVNLVTKSGTSSFHGDVFEFLRNADLDANNYFNNLAGIQRPAFHQNQFGVAAGGPLYIPGIYRQRNKTFIFGYYEGRRQSNPDTLVTTVPTADMKSGNFSSFLNSGTVIYNPFTTVQSSNGYSRAPFSGNMIPAGNIDPVASKLLTYWPSPTQPGLSNNFTSSAPSTAGQDAYTVRVDHNFTDNTRFFARWSQKRQYLSLGAPFFGATNPAGPENLVPDNRWQFASNLSHVFSPTLVMSATLGWSRWIEGRVPQGKDFNPSSLGLPSFLDSFANNFPAINVDGIYGLGAASNGGGSTQNTPRETRTAALDVNKTLGSHTLNAGFTFIDLEQRSEQNSQASFTFPASMTAGPNPVVDTGGVGFASFLLGTGSTGSVVQNAQPAFQKAFWGWYLQDDWKVTSKLTLNLGLRYDFQTAPTERFNQLAWFDFASVNPISSQIGFQVPGEYVYAGGNNGRGLYRPQYTNFAPRVSFAYQMHNRFVMRGGFAMFYIPAIEIGGATPGYSQSTPYEGTANGYQPVNLLSNPFPTGLVPVTGNALGGLTEIGQNVDAYEHYRPTPYVEQWTYSLAYQFGGNDSLEATYIGNHGLKLPLSGLEKNQLPQQDLALGNTLLDQVNNPFYGHITSSACGLNEATVTRAQLLRPYPEYCSVNDDQVPAGSSWYQALEVKFNHRFSHGLQFLASFTYSKYLDNTSGPTSWASGTPDSVQNSYNLAADKSLDPNDIPKSLVLSWVYDLPVGKGKAVGSGFRKVPQAILGNWQVSTIATFKDGFPLSVRTLTNNTNSLGGTQRPNIVGDPKPANQSIYDWVNPEAFSQPAAFTFGNAPRTMGYLRAPGYANWDIGIHKEWNWRELLRLQFRAEFFNTFNRANFYAPTASPGLSYLIPGQFGQITSAFPARDTQFALKLYW